MKILYLLTEPFGVGGVQSDMLALTPGLSRKGHEVSIATSRGERLPDLLRVGGRFIDLQFHFGSLRSLFRCAKELATEASRSDFDIVAPQSIRTTLAAWVALRLLPRVGRASRTLLRTPIVTTIHNVHDPRNFAWAGWLLRICADYVLFESNYERNRLIARGLPVERSRVIYSGVDSDRFRPIGRRLDIMSQLQLDAGNWPIYCMVARMSEEKGHDILLRAFARVLAARPSSRLVLVGDGPLLSDIQRLAEDLEISKSVVFTGMQRDVPSYLSICDVFVLSSTRESFPLSAREAMSSGKAVILPNIGGCPEVVEDRVSGLLFEAGLDESLANQMLALADRPTLIRMQAAALARAEACFSQRAWIDGDEAVYQAMIKK